MPNINLLYNSHLRSAVTKKTILHLFPFSNTIPRQFLPFHSWYSIVPAKISKRNRFESFHYIKNQINNSPSNSEKWDFTTQMFKRVEKCENSGWKCLRKIYMQFFFFFFFDQKIALNLIFFYFIVLFKKNTQISIVLDLAFGIAQHSYK